MTVYWQWLLKRLRGGVTRTLDVLLLVDSFFDNRITIESKGEKQYRMANESSKKVNISQTKGEVFQRSIKTNILGY